MQYCVRYKNKFRNCVIQSDNPIHAWCTRRRRHRRPFVLRCGWHCCWGAKAADSYFEFDKIAWWQRHSRSVGRAGLSAVAAVAAAAVVHCMLPVSLAAYTDGVYNFTIIAAAAAAAAAAADCYFGASPLACIKTRLQRHQRLGATAINIPASACVPVSRARVHAPRSQIYACRTHTLGQILHALTSSLRARARALNDPARITLLRSLVRVVICSTAAAGSGFCLRALASMRARTRACMHVRTRACVRCARKLHSISLETVLCIVPGWGALAG